ncbi:NADH dehydrogenase (quinone) subunit D [bacterium]|nr:NADH dehydrogenase (quinone) subunit D [bacterium]
MSVENLEQIESVFASTSDELKTKVKDRQKKRLIGEDDEESIQAWQKSDTMVLNFGPQHPATHGTLRMVMELSGETIVKLDPSPGYLHTGFEKLGENYTFNQFIAVTDRMNYLSPLSNNIGFAEAAERLLGIDVPLRAQYIRVIQAELSRIADHLVSIGTHALDLGAFTVFLYAFRQREFIYDLFEISTGSRLTTSYTRIGGLFRDFPEGHEQQIKGWCDQFRIVFDQIEGLLNHNKIFQDRTQNVGKIDAKTAINMGLTGPGLRACGIDYDIRKDEPYLVYDRLDFVVPVGNEGDVFERYLVRMEEMKQSCNMIEQCLRDMPKDGPVNVDDHTISLPNKSRVYGSIEGLIHHFKIIMDQHGIDMPKGEVYHATEAPNGELGWYIISDGKGVPYKVHVRPPSFVHFSMMPYLCQGGLVGDAVAVLGSLNVIAGECDR